MPNPTGLSVAVSGPLLASTTLSAAVGAQDLQVTVASATNVTVPSLATGVGGSFLFVNGEMFQVTGQGTGTTTFRVKRGVNGTPAQAHLSAAVVWIGNAATSSTDPSRPFSNALFPMDDASPVLSPTPGIAPGSTPSSAASVSGTTYYSQIKVEVNRPATGIVLLNGATVGTDNLIVALYDFDGNLLANSALAGTLSAGASLYQSIPFVTPVQISGNRSYYIAFQGNGTTALVQKYVTGQVPTNYQAGSITGVFATILNPLVVAGTFTTAKGPIGGIY